MEKDDSKPSDSVEVENELIKDLSEQKGEKSNFEARDERKKTYQNLSSPNSQVNGDLKISEITVQQMVILSFTPHTIIFHVPERILDLS